MSFFSVFFKPKKNIAKPDFIYLRSCDSISKFNFFTNEFSAKYHVTDFINHSETSKKEVADKTSINIWDRLFSTKKYLEYAKSVKGFYNEDKVWKALSKKYLVVFSQGLDHHGVDVLVSKDGKNYFGFQIKSSDYYAQHFRESDKFKNVHGLIIVGKKFDNNSIVSQVKNIIDLYVLN